MSKDTQSFKDKCCAEPKRPLNKPMPMSNPVGLKMAMNNTFNGMPAYPNTYVFEGVTQEPFRPGDLRMPNKDGK